jgi:hypothetical protein
MATLTASGSDYLSRYPTPPQSASVGNLCFPTDLVTFNRPYITLQLAQYNRYSVSEAPIVTPDASLTLPIPIKINDVQTVTWEEQSLTSLGASVVNSIPGIGSTIGFLISEGEKINNLQAPVTGIIANPFLVMLFKTQNFKQHNLKWILAPNNSADQNSLQNIVNTLKNAMLPTYRGPGLGYPKICIPYLSVGTYTYNFKPCAIDSLSVDWSAGATPAFFSDQSPALVSLTMQLKEIELWFQGDIQSPPSL